MISLLSQLLQFASLDPLTVALGIILVLVVGVSGIGLWMLNNIRTNHLHEVSDGLRNVVEELKGMRTDVKQNQVASMTKLDEVVRELLFLSEYFQLLAVPPHPAGLFPLLWFPRTTRLKKSPVRQGTIVPQRAR